MGLFDFFKKKPAAEPEIIEAEPEKIMEMPIEEPVPETVSAEEIAEETIEIKINVILIKSYFNSVDLYLLIKLQIISQVSEMPKREESIEK